MTLSYNLPRRPLLPARAFRSRTLRRNDVTVPPGAGLTTRDNSFICGPMAGPLPSACQVLGRISQKGSIR